MAIDLVRNAFMWCSIINMGILLWWFLFVVLAHDWVYHFHGKWFKLSVERFDTIHYTGIVFFKILIFVFNIIPYVALLIVG